MGLVSGLLRARLRFPKPFIEFEIFVASVLSHDNADLAIPEWHETFSGFPARLDHGLNIKCLLRPLLSPNGPFEGLLVLGLRSGRSQPKLQFDDKNRLLIA